MIRFDFEPKAVHLNKYYERLEKCINEMNKANTMYELEIWEREAFEVLGYIVAINREVIDTNNGGV